MAERWLLTGPIISPHPGFGPVRELEAEHRALNEGIAARLAGLGIDRCPSFLIEDWSGWWRMGWEREDEQSKRPVGF